MFQQFSIMLFSRLVRLGVIEIFEIRLNATNAHITGFIILQQLELIAAE